MHAAINNNPCTADIQIVNRDVASLKFKVLFFFNRLNAFKKGTYTNSIDPDETQHLRRLIRVCAVCQAKHTLDKMIKLMIDYKNRIGPHSLRKLV